MIDVIDVYEAALASNGVAVQLDQAIEELAELIFSINHFRRGRLSDAGLAEEIADVSIMVEQLRRIVGSELVDEAREKKLARLAERVGSSRELPPLAADARTPSPFRLVILESPYAGDVARNVAYARRAMIDSLLRGEAPIASHLLYPQVLDDSTPGKRRLGIDAGIAWRRVADAGVFYVDRGWSPGMLDAHDVYKREGKEIEIRKIEAMP